MLGRGGYQRSPSAEEDRSFQGGSARGAGPFLMERLQVAVLVFELRPIGLLFIQLLLHGVTLEARDGRLLELAWFRLRLATLARVSERREGRGGD